MNSKRKSTPSAAKGNPRGFWITGGREGPMSLGRAKEDSEEASFAWQLCLRPVLLGKLKGSSCLLQRVLATRRTKQSFPLWQLGIATVITTISRKETYSSGSLFLEACLIFKKCPVTPLTETPSFQHCLMFSAGSECFGNAFLGVMNLSMVSTSVSPQENLAWSPCWRQDGISKHSFRHQRISGCFIRLPGAADWGLH